MIDDYLYGLIKELGMKLKSINLTLKDVELLLDTFIREKNRKGNGLSNEKLDIVNRIKIYIRDKKIESFNSKRE